MKQLTLITFALLLGSTTFAANATRCESKTANGHVLVEFVESKAGKHILVTKTSVRIADNVKTQVESKSPYTINGCVNFGGNLTCSQPLSTLGAMAALAINPRIILRKSLVGGTYVLERRFDMHAPSGPFPSTEVLEKGLTCRL